jgi:hypothetical protein
MVISREERETNLSKARAAWMPEALVPRHQPSTISASLTLKNKYYSK